MLMGGGLLTLEPRAGKRWAHSPQAGPSQGQAGQAPGARWGSQTKRRPMRGPRPRLRMSRRAAHVWACGRVCAPPLALTGRSVHMPPHVCAEPRRIKPAQCSSHSTAAAKDAQMHRALLLLRLQEQASPSEPGQEHNAQVRRLEALVQRQQEELAQLRCVQCVCCKIAAARGVHPCKCVACSTCMGDVGLPCDSPRSAAPIPAANTHTGSSAAARCQEHTARQSRGARSKTSQGHSGRRRAAPVQSCLQRRRPPRRWVHKGKRWLAPSRGRTTGECSTREAVVQGACAARGRASMLSSPAAH